MDETADPVGASPKMVGRIVECRHEQKGGYSLDLETIALWRNRSVAGSEPAGSCATQDGATMRNSYIGSTLPRHGRRMSSILVFRTNAPMV